MSKNKPAGKDVVFFDGSYYKLGLHGLPFRYTGESWVRSTKSKTEVKAEIIKSNRSRG